jgi:hypothetical protein
VGAQPKPLGAGAKSVILFKDDVVNLKFDYRGTVASSDLA